MNLDRFDLNLLVAFEALMAEQQVTRAARRLHITQPALSGALARLRTIFDDPLFVQHGKSMRPTMRARELDVPIRSALAQVRQALGRPHFSSQTSTLTARIATSDDLELMMMSKVLGRVRTVAPGIKLIIRRVAGIFELPAEELENSQASERRRQGSDLRVSVSGPGAELQSALAQPPHGRSCSHVAATAHYRCRRRAPGSLSMVAMMFVTAFVGRTTRIFRYWLLAALFAPAAVIAQDSAESARAKQDVLWSNMEESIRAVVQQTDAVVGVAIVDLTDQRSFYLNADAVFPTASTIKIAVLGELYSQHERAASGGSGAKLGDLYTVNAKDGVGDEGVLQTMTPGVTRLTNRDLAALVVALSDNSATNVLIDRVGVDNVNAWLARLGLKETRLRRHMLDVTAAREGRENTATPRELVILLDALYHGRAFRKATTDDFFKMLSTRKNSYLPRLLPAELTIANKPGNLDAVRNDAGVVFVPDRPFAIAVMITFARDDLEAELSIARVARAAWSYFDRVGRSSSLGRIVR